MFKLSPKMWYLLKYGFLILICVGAFWNVFPVYKPQKEPDWLDLLDENVIDSEINSEFSVEFLREDVTDCFITSKEIDEETQFKAGYSRNIYTRLSTDRFSDKQKIFTALTSFSNILSLLDIKAVFMEPSILYCMLLPKYQDLLSKRHFYISEYSESSRVITYGIMEEDVRTLEKAESIEKFSMIDFKIHFVDESRTSFSHIFFMHTNCIIHVVVLHRRSKFFWHAALDMTEKEKLLLNEKLLFTDHDGAYEKFLFVSLENRILPVADFYVPSNVPYFLFEMMSSRFLECNFSRTTFALGTNQPTSHPKLSVKQFNKRFHFALRELKKIFHPLLMNLWIWSGTMLGWYRQCDIIPYTSDVDFASWASDVDDLDQIINMVKSSKYISIQERMGFLQEALEFNIDCHDLRTDIFFMYPLENGSWYSGHSPREGYYFRYFHPPFTLCSSELLGEKVQVPCETENAIAAEYGPDWSKPISAWDYESSPKNRGPNIYWEKEKLENAYESYKS